jgi:hypothetical protein
VSSRSKYLSPGTDLTPPPVAASPANNSLHADTRYTHDTITSAYYKGFMSFLYRSCIDRRTLTLGSCYGVESCATSPYRSDQPSKEHQPPLAYDDSSPLLRGSGFREALADLPEPIWPVILPRLLRPSGRTSGCQSS